MPRKTVNRLIGPLDVTTTQHGSTAAGVLLVKLMKIAGPAIGEIAPLLNAAKGGSLEDIAALDVKVLGPALMVLAEQLDAASFEKLLVDVLRGTIVIANDGNGQVKHDLSAGRQAIDAAFDGRLRDMFAVAAFALEVNFGDFFGGSGPGAPSPPAG